MMPISFAASALVLAGLLTSTFPLMGWGGPSTLTPPSNDIMVIHVGEDPTTTGVGGRHLPTSTRKFKVLERVGHNGTSFM